MAGAVIALLILVLALQINVGCDDAFEQPCRVERQEVLATDTTIAPGSVILARTKDRVLAVWVHRDVGDGGSEPDAGSDAGDGGDAAGDAGDLTDAASSPSLTVPTISGFEVVETNEQSVVSVRTNVPAPRALHGRRDSTENVGLVAEDDGAFLIHWTETITTTDPLDGRLRKASTLKLAYNGQAEPLPLSVLPPSASCEHCLVTLTSLSLGRDSVLFLRIDPDVNDIALGARLPPQPVFHALRVRRDGAVSEVSVPWLALPTPSRDAGIAGVGAAPSARDVAIDAFVDGNGRIVVSNNGYAWLASSALELIRGPLTLPAGATDARVSWDLGSSSGSGSGAGAGAGEASIGWSVSPLQDKRSEREQPREVFTGLVPSGGAGIATRERASRGRLVLALDRRGSDVGIVFESAGRTFFAALDPQGRKRGGDVLLSTSTSTRSQTEFGIPDAPDDAIVLVRAEGRFSVITLGSGKLTASEIHCAAP